MTNDKRINWAWFCDLVCGPCLDHDSYGRMCYQETCTAQDDGTDCPFWASLEDAELPPDGYPKSNAANYGSSAMHVEKFIRAVKKAHGDLLHGIERSVQTTPDTYKDGGEGQ